MSTIHITSPSGTKSEHETGDLRSMWEQGILEEGTQYWKEGMPEWRPLNELFQPSSVASPFSAPPPPRAPVYAYTKNPRALTSLLVVMLWISLASEVVSMLGDFGQMSLLAQPFTEAEGLANDSRQLTIGRVCLGVFIVTGVVFLKWIYRANLNCWGFGAKRMKFTPGQSIGCYFIPFVNLVRPYHAMKEIWEVSQDPKHWKPRDAAALLGWWWGLWLASGIVGQMVFRFSMNADTIGEFQRSTGLSLFHGLIEVSLCVVAIKLVKTIAAKQEELVTNSGRGSGM